MSNVLNKKVIADVLAEKHDFSKKEATDVVNDFVEVITDALAKGDTVDLFGFGKFLVKDRPARQGVNPATGEKIQIKASKVPAFKAAKALKELVK
ncbi:MAG: HU family DNA-binding protein [Erysipelotrichaceae bacterium]